MRVGDILPHPMNPKIHPEGQLSPLKGLLETVGKLDDLKAYRSERAGGALVFFDGHGRRELDPDAEWDVDIYDLTDAEADLAVATFDPIGWQAEQSRARLDELLREVSTDNAALMELMAKEAEAAGIVPLLAEKTPGAGGDQFDTTPDEAQTRVRSGDLWRLGDHRLLCGDSTNKDNVIRLMVGERAVLFATDPPYLVEYDGTNHPHKWNDPPERKNKNKDWSETYHDWDSAEDQPGLYEGFVSVAVEHAITEHAAWYCWHASRNQAMVESVWEQFGAFVHQQIIWVKNRPILTRSWYMWSHEPCFFGWLRGNKPKRCASDYPSSTWHIETVAAFAKTEHPTSKPIEIFAIPIRQHTEAGDLCYEPFAGSGSQIIAAERLSRRCFAIEREPKYCDVILRRWEAETGQEAQLLERLDGQ